MKDQKIKVSAGEEAETGAVTMLQKQLTATASISTANKVYDSKTALREGSNSNIHNRYWRSTEL